MTGLRAFDRKERTRKYRIDEEFERLLAEANALLIPLERQLQDEQPEPQKPLVIICFAPRSGSTFLAQVLARTNGYHYVSNFNARFWEAPLFSMVLEKKLGLRDIPLNSSAESDYGVPAHSSEPHEFGFFWTKWLPRTEGTDVVDLQDFDQKRQKEFVACLNALRAAENKPFLIKNGVVGINVKLFQTLFPDVRFIVLEREPIYIAQSLYQARLDLYGSASEYLSTRPSDYASLLNYPVYEQIARQIKSIYRDIRESLRECKAESITVQYEKLTTNLRHEVSRIVEFTDANEADLSRLEGMVPKTNRRYLDEETWGRLARAIEKCF